MTTYDKVLDIIIQRQNELDISTRRLAKLVSVDYQCMLNYLSSKYRMPTDVMFATLAALGYKVEVIPCFQKI